MAKTGAEVQLYLDHVKITVEKATAEVLKKLAFRVIERAQLNIRQNDQVDTGFMVNSGYAVWSDGSSYGQGAISAEGREMAPEESLAGEAIAAAIFGANYAIYQEAAKPFLYPGAEAAAAEFGGEAERIYKEHIPEEGPRA